MKPGSCSLACILSLLALSAPAALGAEHIPGTASSRPAAIPASATSSQQMKSLLYGTGTDARHAHLARLRHSAVGGEAVTVPA